MNIPITPKDVPTTLTLNKLVITGVVVQLNLSANIAYQLTFADQSGTIHDTMISDNLVMPTDVYNQWASSDQFLIDWVLSQLGLYPAGYVAQATGNALIQDEVNFNDNYIDVTTEPKAKPIAMPSNQKRGILSKWGKLG